MGKDVKNSEERRAGIRRRGAGQGEDGLTATLEALRGDLRAFVIGVGYRVFLELLEEERGCCVGRGTRTVRSDRHTATGMTREFGVRGARSRCRSRGYGVLWQGARAGDLAGGIGDGPA